LLEIGADRRKFCIKAPGRELILLNAKCQSSKVKAMAKTKGQTGVESIARNGAGPFDTLGFEAPEVFFGHLSLGFEL
jgi:hypothetical protein